MADTCPKCGGCQSSNRHWTCQSFTTTNGAFQQSNACRVHELESAIRTHRSQKADDRCILDDDTLYEVLGDSIKCDRHVGDKDAMLANCKRFIERRCEGGKWPTYAELEALVGHLISCGATAAKSNTDEWMEYWRDELNAAVAKVGLPERVRYRRGGFVIDGPPR